MAKHLTDRDIEKIVMILDGWSEKITWDLLCQACEPIIGTKPARQTLMKFARVSSAYEACKERLKNGVAELPVPPTMKVAAERIARLERENERVKRENAELLQQFVVWQYNAHINGLDKYQLDKTLPGIGRGQTD